VTRTKSKPATWAELPARRRARFLRLMREWESENEAMSTMRIGGEHAEVANDTRLAIAALKDAARKGKR
jgi:CTP synthase (UTP-ammonia lyase)